MKILLRKMDAWDEAHPSLSAALGAGLTLGAIVAWTLALALLGD